MHVVCEANLSIGEAYQASLNQRDESHQARELVVLPYETREARVCWHHVRMLGNNLNLDVGEEKEPSQEPGKPSASDGGN